MSHGMLIRDWSKGKKRHRKTDPHTQLGEEQQLAAGRLKNTQNLHRYVDRSLSRAFTTRPTLIWLLQWNEIFRLVQMSPYQQLINIQRRPDRFSQLSVEWTYLPWVAMLYDIKQRANWYFLHYPLITHPVDCLWILDYQYHPTSWFKGAFWTTFELSLLAFKWMGSTFVALWLKTTPTFSVFILWVGAGWGSNFRGGAFTGGRCGSSPMLTDKFVYNGSNSLDRSS